MIALQNLMEAFESRDYSSLSLQDIFQLLERGFIRIETARRLAMEVQHVS